MKLNDDKIEKTFYVLYQAELRSKHSERPDSNRRPRPLEGCSPFSIRLENDWSRRRDSNPQPRVYETRALPLSYVARKLVRRVRFELTLPRLKGECLNQLGHRRVTEIIGRQTRCGRMHRRTKDEQAHCGPRYVLMHSFALASTTSRVCLGKTV